VEGFSTKVETVDELTDYIDSVLIVYNKCADKQTKRTPGINHKTYWAD
jgi:hypothetical protein